MTMTNDDDKWQIISDNDNDKQWKIMMKNDHDKWRWQKTITNDDDK